MSKDWFGDEVHPNIEQWWRDKFADELDEQIVTSTDAPSTKWFNEGVKYAAMFLRHAGGHREEPR